MKKKFNELKFLAIKRRKEGAWHAAHAKLEEHREIKRQLDEMLYRAMQQHGIRVFGIFENDKKRPLTEIQHILNDFPAKISEITAEYRLSDRAYALDSFKPLYLKLDEVKKVYNEYLILADVLDGCSLGYNALEEFAARYMKIENTQFMVAGA